MLGGASQTVSKIRVKCNGKQKNTHRRVHSQHEGGEAHCAPLSVVLRVAARKRRRVDVVVVRLAGAPGVHVEVGEGKGLQPGLCVDAAQSLFLELERDCRAVEEEWKRRRRRRGGGERGALLGGETRRVGGIVKDVRGSESNCEQDSRKM